MRLLLIIGLVTASGCLAQEQAPKPEDPSSEVQQQSPAASEKQVITVPGGTRIPLVLTSPVGTKSSQPGDPVRAETAFPVTVDNRVAVPLGTYVAGEIAAVTRPSSSRRAGLQMHFTRVIFANGYEVALFEDSAEAKVRNPGASSPVASNHGIQSAIVDRQSFQQTPVLYSMPGNPQQPPARLRRESAADSRGRRQEGRETVIPIGSPVVFTKLSSFPAPPSVSCRHARRRLHHTRTTRFAT